MPIKIPYSQLEITISSLSAVTKLNDEKIQKQILEEFEPIIDTNNLNEKVAKFHSISIKDLIDSPNLTTLIELYKEHIFFEGIRIFEKYGLTNQEAYAIMLSRG